MTTPLTLGPSRPENAPAYFHVLAKPTGAICNLDCTYCFFLSKEALYPGSPFRMQDEVLEAYIRQLVESQVGPLVTIAWQGGEPTLMGLDFFRRSMELVQRYTRPGITIEHTIQTNGTLLDESWCSFFKEHRVLVGLSIDGPREMHDAYRLDKRGAPTFDRVIAAANLLQRTGVDFNILCTVHARNADHPLEVYRFFRDELGAQYLQFIPIVERATAETLPIANLGWGDRSAPLPGETPVARSAQRPLYTLQGSLVTERSVTASQWGRFQIEIFDEWVHRDVGKVFVQGFDSALGSWVGRGASLCIHRETCGDALALEHNGDLYSCDHFVEPAFFLGNIRESHMLELVASDRQRTFGDDKRDTLPRYCRECEVRFACNGECPRNRFLASPDGEPGLNYLCAGYREFFNHVDRPMRIMADLLKRGRHADEVMDILAEEREAGWIRQAAGLSRNAACPCGSGRKVKHCHGKEAGG